MNEWGKGHHRGLLLDIFLTHTHIVSHLGEWGRRHLVEQPIEALCRFKIEEGRGREDDHKESRREASQR